MQPSPGDVHVNTPLTSISIAMIQGATNFVADRVFPVVPVAKQSDRYYTYDRGTFNRDEMAKRAPGTESVGSGYTLDNTPTYFCDVYALHKDVDDQVLANQDSVLDGHRDATTFLTQKALIRKEKLFTSSYMTTSLWTTDITGVAASPTGSQALQWNDAASNPIKNVRDGKRTVLQSTGFEPNKLVLGRAVYDALVDHPDIIDRLKYGQTAGAPAQAGVQALARLFEVDEVLVMNAIENTAAEGQTNSHAFIGGKVALLCYAAPRPALLSPSAGYTFAWSGFMGSQSTGTRIKQFRMEHLEADRVEIQMAMTQKLISADLGYFFTSIVS